MPALKCGGANASPSFLNRTGISLKPKYYEEILRAHPAVGFFEIHAENYLSEGGPVPHFLERIRAHYPITVHGVGLSLGGETPLNLEHLDRVARLVERVEPEVFSEHLAWSSHQGTFFNDLLPVPYTNATLTQLCRHVDQVQERLQRRILIENPSTYFRFQASVLEEVEFIRELTQRTGCGLLLDVNNVEVSCFNHEASPYLYLDQFPMDAVAQIHIAGHTLDEHAVPPLKIDSHDAPVTTEVWGLYRHALELIGDCPTLIERDGNLPELTQLISEAHYADSLRKLGVEAKGC